MKKKNFTFSLGHSDADCLDFKTDVGSFKDLRLTADDLKETKQSKFFFIFIKF